MIIVMIIVLNFIYVSHVSQRLTRRQGAGMYVEVDYNYVDYNARVRDADALVPKRRHSICGCQARGI